MPIADAPDMERRADRWTWAVLLAVTLGAFGLRLGVTQAFVGLSSPPDADANSDQLDYELIGWSLAQGRGFVLEDGTPTARRAPGTSLLLAPVYAVTGRSFTAARLWFVALSAATCLVTGVLAWVVFGRVAAVASAALLAVYPGHFYYAMHLLSEAPAGLTLALAALATLAAGRSRRALPSAVAGVAWGVTLLVRPQVLLLPLVALPMTLLAPRGQRAAWATRVAVMALACALTLAPWVVRNAVVMGKPTLTTCSGLLFWGSHNDVVFSDPAQRGGWVKGSELMKTHPLTGGEAAVDSAAMRLAIASAREHWRQMPALVAAKLVRFFQPVHDTPNRAVRLAFTVGWAGVGILAAVGLGLALRRRGSEQYTHDNAGYGEAPSAGSKTRHPLPGGEGTDRAGVVVLLAPFLATVLMTVLSYGLDRFRDGAAPVFVPFAGYAVAWLAFRARLFATSLRCNATGGWSWRAAPAPGTPGAHAARM